MNGAAGNFLATAEDLKTKGFRVGALSCCHVAMLSSCGGCPSVHGWSGREGAGAGVADGLGLTGRSGGSFLHILGRR